MTPYTPTLALRASPAPEWIAAIRARFPVERALDAVLTRKLVQRAEPREQQMDFSTLEPRLLAYLRGVTGEAMLQQLETRLDNVLFRSGLVSSRAQARQLITHRHLLIAGHIVNVPSYQVKPGMVIEVREKSRKADVFQQAGAVRRAPGWLSVDTDNKRIQMLSVPAREEMDLPETQEQLVVEYYSR